MEEEQKISLWQRRRYTDINEAEGDKAAGNCENIF
jgi:hypothetical protein